MYPRTKPGSVGRFTEGQIATRSTWNRLPDMPTNFSAMSVIRVHPVGGSTIVQLNPLDPGTTDAGDNTAGTEWGPGWLERPGGYGHIARHGRA